MSLKAKSLCAEVMDSCGVLRNRLARKTTDVWTIFMYHRILPESEVGPTVQRGMFVTPGTFAEHLQFFQEYFHIVSVAEWLERTGIARDSGMKPVCMLTFDDGWSDFMVHAYPLLKAVKAPALVFLPTDFIGTNGWFWTDRLASMLAQRCGETAREPLPDKSSTEVRALEALRGPLAARIETAIGRLKKLRPETIEELLAQLASRWNVRHQPPGRAFLSWEEVRSMRDSGHISFGSHTARHRLLPNLKDEEIRDELERSKSRLLSERVVDPSCVPFCYPNGDHDRRTISLVREAGYHLAVTTQRGFNGKDDDLFRLKRIGLHQDIAGSRALLGCRIAGLT